MNVYCIDYVASRHIYRQNEFRRKQSSVFFVHSNRWIIEWYAGVQKYNKAVYII